MKRAIAALLLFTLAASPLAAGADLGSPRDVAGIRLYADHERSDLWYLAPPAPRLAVDSQGGPAYRLDLFRYGGRTGTGDEQLFWARAVLALELSRERPPERLAAVRAALGAAGIPRPTLRTMPVSGASLRLLFGDLDQSWAEDVRWREGLVLVGLEQDLAQILWQSLEAGQTLISLELTERLAGMRREEDQWVEAETAAHWTVQATLDPELYPDRLRKTDLDATMTRGYTALEVFCFDFLESLEPDLYAKEVAVAIPTAGRDLVQTARFDADSDYRIRLEFPLSKDLDAPYKVRETRTYLDGRRESGEWHERHGEYLLDVTAYREPENESPSGEAGEEREPSPMDSDTDPPGG